MSSMFETDPNIEGILIGKMKDSQLYLIRIPYSKKGVKKINGGLFIGIENFLSNENLKCYSVLEIIKAEPVHYALGSKAEKLLDEYFGFVEIAARSLFKDWEQIEPEEEVTRIQIEASPLGVMLTWDPIKDVHDIVDDESTPMLGGSVRLLTNNTMSSVINHKIPPEKSIEFGTLLANDSVKIKVNATELCKTHFGLFGFTRSGKSNLASNIIASFYTDLKNGNEKRKSVVIDFTNEYFGLLADCFKNVQDSYLLILDADRLNEISPGFSKVLTNEKTRLNFAKAIIENMVLQELESNSEDLINILIKVLEEGRVKVFLPRQLGQEVGRRFQNVISTYDPSHLGRARGAVYSWIEGIDHPRIKLDTDLLREIADRFDRESRAQRIFRINTGRVLRQGTIDSYREGQTPNLELDDLFDFNERVDNASETSCICIREMARSLRKLADEWDFIETLPDKLIMKLSEISDKLDDETQNSLFVATSDRADDLAEFFSEVTTRQYYRRRNSGRKSPSVLFLVDEADEFIPQESDARGTRVGSRQAAELLARRSGKLGMGLGIATQRVAHLCTKVISQLHTYFVSKLPRRSDRSTIAEAFGIQIELIDRSLELKKGQWVVISHSALGIPITPFLAKFPNAIERVIDNIHPRDERRES